MKKILTLLLIGVLVFVFSGCSKTDNKQTTSSTSTNQNSPPKNESQSTNPSTNNQSSSPATNGTSSNTNQQSSNTNQQSSSSTKSSSQTQKPTVKTDKELAGEFGRDLVLKAVKQWKLDNIANTEFAKYPFYKENYEDFTYIFPGKYAMLRSSTLLKIHGTNTPQVKQLSSNKFVVDAYISFNAEYEQEIRTYDGNVHFTVIKSNGQFKVYDTPVANYNSINVEFKP